MVPRSRDGGKKLRWILSKRRAHQVRSFDGLSNTTFCGQTLYVSDAIHHITGTPKGVKPCRMCAKWPKSSRWNQPFQAVDGTIHRIKKQTSPVHYTAICSKNYVGFPMGGLPKYDTVKCLDCHNLTNALADAKKQRDKARAEAPYRPFFLSTDRVLSAPHKQINNIVICELHFADGHVEIRTVDRHPWRAARWCRAIPGVQKVDLISWRSRAVLGSVTEVGDDAPTPPEPTRVVGYASSP